MLRLVVTSLAALLCGTVMAAPLEAPGLAPYYPVTGDYPVISDSYTVRFKEDHSLAEHLKIVPALADVAIHELTTLNAYIALLPEPLFTLVRQDTGVLYVEGHAKGRLADAQALPLKSSLRNISEIESKSRLDVLKARDQTNDVGYGLSYLSSLQKHPQTNAYFYQADLAQGVDIYIMDSGINYNSDFDPAVNHLQDYSGESPNFADNANHGTSVAACAGGKTWGSAKKPNLLDVKVTMGSNIPDGNFQKGMDYIIARHNAAKGTSSFKGSVINMSFGVSSSKTNLDYVEKAANAGLFMVTAAGNSGVDAGSTFPCNSGYVACVGASNVNYQLYSGSNYGTDVDYIASGENVDSISSSGQNVQVTGTSFASPYVAGVAANFYGYEGTAMTRELAAMRLDQNADSGYLENLPSSQINRMANSGYQKGQAKDGKPYLQSY